MALPIVPIISGIVAVAKAIPVIGKWISGIGGMIKRYRIKKRKEKIHNAESPGEFEDIIK